MKNVEKKQAAVKSWKERRNRKRESKNIIAGEFEEGMYLK